MTAAQAKVRVDRTTDAHGPGVGAKPSPNRSLPEHARPGHRPSEFAMSKESYRGVMNYYS